MKVALRCVAEVGAAGVRLLQYGTGCLLGGPSEEWLTFFVSRKAPTNSVQPAKVIEG